ncbi:allene oxide synthase 2-like [Iris pallida]|uniref:Allene oxide synthase 2-like n=1 Tax=Iris pallida TaxID=29817 RepID=A0AAX6HSH6_IRIPA|nr:allene oxide synthase 2-like [Iris pallida]
MSTSKNEEEYKSGALPLRAVPGGYGVPFFGPIRDRLDFFYNQGQYRYFYSRAAKHNSTVFRTNMIPGPLCSDSHIVAACDAKSFAVVFDPSKVDKKNVLIGNLFPSVGFNGGHRILAYLDPSEPKHAQNKQVLFNIIAARKSALIPAFFSVYSSLFDKLEAQLASSKKSNFNKLNEFSAFDYVNQAMYGRSPSESTLKAALKWVLLQFHPITTIGLPKLIEDPLLHLFLYPPFVARSTYRTLTDFFSDVGASALDDAESLGLSRDEALHSLVFSTVINAYLGVRAYLNRLLKWVVSAGPELHDRLAREIRSVVKADGGKVTLSGLERMELTKSVVYEAFRIDPPVQVQYGRAKLDFELESHDAKYSVKEGELICGFQPMATRDPKVFERPEEFVPDRFVGEEGEKLLKYVVWSNGPETEATSVANKMCAGKDVGVLVGRLLMVVVFTRYDKLEGEVGTTPEDVNVNITGLTKSEVNVVEESAL